jgi:hypothetical protein
MNARDSFGNQSIHCDVHSCLYNDERQSGCTLSSIQVQANAGGNTGKACDESNCGSYVPKN